MTCSSLLLPYGPDHEVIVGLQAMLSQEREAWGASASGPTMLQAPSVSDLSAVINAAFWSSLLANEKRPIRCSFQFSAAREEAGVFRLTEPVPLDPRDVARIAPALDPCQSAFYLDPATSPPRVWGFGPVQLWQAYVEVVEAAHVVVRHWGTVVAVFERSNARLLDVRAAPAAALFGMLFPRGDVARMTWGEALKQAVSQMRSQRSGGTLLIVPAGEDSWRQALHSPTLEHHGGYRELSDALERMLEARLEGGCWKWRNEIGSMEPHQILIHQEAERDIVGAIRRASTSVGRLTAIDGAVVLGTDGVVHAVGAKIDVLGPPEMEVQTFLVGQPQELEPPELVTAASLGGTRHLSAIRFVESRKRCFAIVASEDGPVSIVVWVPRTSRVAVLQRAEYLFL